jgi:cellulose synthase/poly-beta-1,6-N-acetylglucosamine synthase-like glycosyltransferase
MVQVFVVADNCSDRTAEIAAALGATVLVRHNVSHRGKGHALEWAFERVLPHGHDGVVVLDADCGLEPHALRAFDRCLSEGSYVLQANDVAANPDHSATSYVASVANLLENDFFYAPKSYLGWAVFLRGTGMVFHREILQRYPWQARSIVEDVVYTVRLLREGIAVRFLDDVRVHSDFPVTGQQLSVQRTRWVGGNFRFALWHVVPLIWEGLRRRQMSLLDAGWTLVVSLRTLVLAELCIALLVCLAAAWASPGVISSMLLLAGWVTGLTYVLYFALGAYFLGLTAGRVRLLLHSPLVITKMLHVAVTGIFRVNPYVWLKTPKAHE